MLCVLGAVCPAARIEQLVPALAHMGPGSQATPKARGDGFTASDTIWKTGGETGWGWDAPMGSRFPGFLLHDTMVLRTHLKVSKVQGSLCMHCLLDGDLHLSSMPGNDALSGISVLRASVCCWRWVVLQM